MCCRCWGTAPELAMLTRALSALPKPVRWSTLSSSASTIPPPISIALMPPSPLGYLRGKRLSSVGSLRTLKKAVRAAQLPTTRQEQCAQIELPDPNDVGAACGRRPPNPWCLAAWIRSALAPLRVATRHNRARPWRFDLGTLVVPHPTRSWRLRRIPPAFFRLFWRDTWHRRPAAAGQVYREGCYRLGRATGRCQYWLKQQPNARQSSEYCPA